VTGLATPAFKVDENLPGDLVLLLRDSGFDAVGVADPGLGGAKDERIAQVCLAEGRVVVSLDLDFGDIRTFPPERYPGIIVLRVDRQDVPHVLQVFRRVISELAVQSPAAHLWIVDESSIRIRGA
jgi:predicted nuclease of predicted toxin-antitoxin system